MDRDLGALEARIRQHLVLGHLAEAGIVGFRKQRSLRTWAYKVAWNAAHMFWRDPFRRRGRRLATSEYSRVAERLGVENVLAEAEDAPPDVGALRKRFERLKERLLHMAEKEGLLESRSH